MFNNTNLKGQGLNSYFAKLEACNYLLIISNLLEKNQKKIFFTQFMFQAFIITFEALLVLIAVQKAPIHGPSAFRTPEVLPIIALAFTQLELILHIQDFQR